MWAPLWAHSSRHPSHYPLGGKSLRNQKSKLPYSSKKWSYTPKTLPSRRREPTKTKNLSSHIHPKSGSRHPSHYPLGGESLRNQKSKLPYSSKKWSYTPKTLPSRRREPTTTKNLSSHIHPKSGSRHPSHYPLGGESLQNQKSKLPYSSKKWSYTPKTLPSRKIYASTFIQNVALVLEANDLGV
jgi:hypothetical protein